MNKTKWCANIKQILLCIFLLPFALAGYVIDRLKDKKVNSKQEKDQPPTYLFNGRQLTMEEYKEHLPIYKYHYQEPIVPLPDEELYARILEVVCI